MTSVYSQTRWSLADLFPAVSSPELTTTLEQLEVETGAFEARRPELAPDIPLDRFLAIIRELEHINHLAYRVYSFASLSFAADTQDQVAQTFLGRVRQIMAGLENRTLFFSLWWKDLDDENAGRLLAGAGDYHYWLEEMRHFKPHTLSEAEEKVVNLKNTTGAGALRNLYDSITNRYVYQVPVDGVVKEMTRGELMSLVRTADPDVRAAAYQELYRVYAADAPILGQIYQSLVWDWRNEQVDLRRFTSPLSARNLTNDIPDQVVNTLLDACQRNAPIFQRFFRLKAGLLGLQRLRRYDVYAPIASTEKTYDFGVAAEMVLDAFQRFDSGLAGQARQVFEVNHLDSEVRKGKRSGAFCATVTPDLVPWVLVNFQGRPDDIATLAHELGHAVHALLASHHSLFTQHSSLPLAETASTFGEMILLDRLLELENDPSVQRTMLFRQMDDAYATIQRQAYFALFERQAHAMIHQGASVEELSTAYLQNLHDQFGDSVEVSDEFRYEWISIPHIYQVPFYVYAYSFGQLLVLSLYQQFKAEGAAFKPRYLQILASGGSDSPAAILSRAGIDIYSPAFWQGGFDVLDGMVQRLEALTSS